MDNNIEQKISDYIDDLNNEVKPSEQNEMNTSKEYEELMDTVRRVKSLKEPEYPGEDFSHKLTASLREGREKNKIKYPWIMRTAAVAAMVAVVFLVNMFLPETKGNMVSAMEKAWKELNAYHGIIEVTEVNGQGEEILQGKREAFANQNGQYYLKEMEGSAKGMITVNNGEKKWQIHEKNKEIHVFSAFPDGYRFTFELGKEVKNVKNALDIKAIGEENILGRKTSKIEVTSMGGAIYYLWIDKETNLPLQKETAMKNGISYRITYTEIEYLDAIPEEFLAYDVPQGFKVIDEKAEQVMDNMEEARELLGFDPMILREPPKGYTLDTIGVETKNNRLKLYYKNGKHTVIISKGKSDGELKSDSSAMIGKVNGNTAQIYESVDNREGFLTGGGAYANMTDINMVRWIEAGYEYYVMGNIDVKEMKEFVDEISQGELMIPEQKEDTGKGEISVNVNMEIEESDQKSVDGGNSSWKLDPAYVTQVFVSLLIMPDGIEGDYPIAYEDIIVEENSGIDAVAVIHNEKPPAG